MRKYRSITLRVRTHPFPYQLRIIPASPFVCAVTADQRQFGYGEIRGLNDTGLNVNKTVEYLLMKEVVSWLTLTGYLSTAEGFS